MKLSTLLFFTGFSLSFCFAQVTQVTVQPASTANNDTYVVLNSTSQYYLANKLSVFVDGTQSSPIIRRTFIDFDLTSIPSNAIIVDAKLHLYKTYGNNNITVELARVVDSWDESLIDGTSMPNIDASSASVQSVSLTSGWHIFDVDSDVQHFVNYSHLNKGWRLKSNSESIISSLCYDLWGNPFPCHSTQGTEYASAEYITSSLRPKLVIDYVLPIEIGLDQIIHADDPNSSNGSISITADEGNGTYTYQWIDGATGSDISGETSSTIEDLSPGWYGVKVTDGLGNISYMAFIVGTKCGEVEIVFNPGPNFIDDASVIKSLTGSFGDNSYGSSNEINTGRWPIFRGWIDGRTIFRNNLIIPSNIQLVKADQYFYGKGGHVYSNGNGVKLLRNISDWQEPVVTWNIQPSVDNVIQTLASTSSASQDDVVDLTNYYRDLQDLIYPNFGYSIHLNYAVQNIHRTRNYHSSEATSSSTWPKLILKVGEICLEGYAHVKRSLDAGYTRTRLGVLKFQFDERYEQPISENLVYTIYDENRQVVAVLENLSIDFSDNRHDLDLTSEGLTQDEIYILEITVSKNEKRYLKFKYTL